MNVFTHTGVIQWRALPWCSTLCWHNTHQYAFLSRLIEETWSTNNDNYMFTTEDCCVLKTPHMLLISSFITLCTKRIFDRDVNVKGDCNIITKAGFLLLVDSNTFKVTVTHILLFISAMQLLLFCCPPLTLMLCKIVFILAYTCSDIVIQCIWNNKTISAVNVCNCGKVPERGDYNSSPRSRITTRVFVFCLFVCYGSGDRGEYSRCVAQ